MQDYLKELFANEPSLDEDLQDLAMRASWNVEEYVDALAMMKHFDILNDERFEDFELVEQSIEDYFQAVYLGVKRKELKLIPKLRREKEKTSYLPWQFGLIYNLRIFLRDNITMRIRSLSPASRMLDRYISAADGVKFAISKGWPIHHRFLAILDPNAHKLAGLQAASAEEPTKRRGKPGADGRWKKREKLVDSAEILMGTMLELGCHCNHEKLAFIAFALGKCLDGQPLRDHEKKGFGLYGAIKTRAKTLVPVERQFGEPQYDPAACECPITEHATFKLPRHGQ